MVHRPNQLESGDRVFQLENTHRQRDKTRHRLNLSLNVGVEMCVFHGFDGRFYGLVRSHDSNKECAAGCDILYELRSGVEILMHVSMLSPTAS